MARKTVKFSRTPAGWRASCPDCSTTATHEESVKALGMIADHGAEKHGWTDFPRAKGVR